MFCAAQVCIDGLIDGVFELVKEERQDVRDRLLRGFAVFVPMQQRFNY